MNNLNNVIEEIDREIAKHNFEFASGFSFLTKHENNQLRKDGIIVKKGIH